MSHFEKNTLRIPANGLELNFTYHYTLGGRISTEMSRSVFGAAAFLQDPLEIQSTPPFRAEDIQAPFDLWEKIQAARDPLSQYLRRQFSAAVLKQLGPGEKSDASKLFLQTILSNKLNQFLISNRFPPENPLQETADPNTTFEPTDKTDRISLNRHRLKQCYPGLLSDKAPIKQQCVIQFNSLRSAQATAYFSDHFLDEIILTQFQISIKNSPSTHNHLPGIDEFRININQGDGEFIEHPFMLSEKYDLYEGISSIEVTLWKYGFLSLNIRLQNKSTLSACHLLEAICHPELIRRRSDSHGQKIGELLVQAEFFRHKMDHVILHALNKLELKRLTLASGAWENIPEYGHDEPLTCSRPYIGTVLFKTEVADKTESEKKELMQKHLVVAAGRTTPAFLTKFDNVCNYLTGYRNVYNASGSILYIARRGWCVLDSDERDKMTFRLGVIEATHIVINIINTAARAQRQFARLIHHEGAFVFEELNIKVKQMVSDPAQQGHDNESGRGSRGVSKKELKEKEKILKIKKQETAQEFSKWIAEATSFMARARLVSPFGDMTELLESHLLANTSRSAVHRCKYLTGLDDLRAMSQEMMRNYTELLQTSSNYLNMVAAQNTERTRKSTQVRMWLAVFGIIIGLLGWFFGGR